MEHFHTRLKERRRHLPVEGCAPPLYCHSVPSYECEETVGVAREIACDPDRENNRLLLHKYGVPHCAKGQTLQLRYGCLLPDPRRQYNQKQFVEDLTSGSLLAEPSALVSRTPKTRSFLAESQKQEIALGEN